MKRKQSPFVRLGQTSEGSSGSPMAKSERKIICIVGPTSSGKTGLAVKVAAKFGGEIISADSRQVYRRLDIGTGKEGMPNLAAISNLKSQISKTKLKNKKFENSLKIKNCKIVKLRDNICWIDDVPQWLIDICEPGEKFTMFDWLELARQIIDDIFERGKVPILVGGTGLYIQALIEGFELKPENDKFLIPNDKLNPKSQNSKKYTREELERKSLNDLQKIYLKLEISNLKLDFKNHRRLIRAIEKAQKGIRVSKLPPDFDVLQIGIILPREKLYQKIDKRVDDRFEQGMLEEVRGLLSSGIDPNWLVSLGLEYRIISNYLLETPRLSFEQMSQNLKFKIHAYARRQLTWFRRFPEIKWVKNKNEALKLARKYLHLVEK